MAATHAASIPSPISRPRAERMLRPKAGAFSPAIRVGSSGGRTAVSVFPLNQGPARPRLEPWRHPGLQPAYCVVSVTCPSSLDRAPLTFAV